MVRAAKPAKAGEKADPSIVATSLRLDPQMKAELEIAAKADDRTFASLVTKILRDWLKANRA